MRVDLPLDKNTVENQDWATGPPDRGAVAGRWAFGPPGCRAVTDRGPRACFWQNRKGLLPKLAFKPTYLNSKIFNEDLVAVHKIKETLTLDRPAYVGMCTLDLSKTLMYDFHYNNIKKKYRSRAKLLFTDTDSLMYEIKAKDVYKDFWADKEKFDNSDYSKDNQYFDPTNKKVKLKDEPAGIPITEK